MADDALDFESINEYLDNVEIWSAEGVFTTRANIMNNNSVIRHRLLKCIGRVEGKSYYRMTEKAKAMSADEFWKLFMEA